MEEFFNVVAIGLVAYVLGLISQYLWTKLGKKHFVLYGVLSFIIGMIIHSSMCHTFGDRLKEIFHWFDKKKEKD